MMNLQEIYLALFGRPADPAGLRYWSGHIDAGALPVDMVARISDSAEYREVHHGLSPAAIIDTVFLYLFGRDMDDAGLALLTAELASGQTTLPAIVLRLIETAQDTDRAVLTEKLAATELYTGRLDTEAEIAAYHGEDAGAAARHFLRWVTDKNPATTEAVDRAILALLSPDGAQTPAEGGGEEDAFRLNAAITPHRLEDGEKQLLIGEGSAEGFALATAAGLELGISLRDGHGDPLLSSGYRDGTVAQFDDAPAKGSLLLSIASLAQRQLDDFTLRLSLDTDPGAGVSFRHYLLQGNADEGYAWALDDNHDGIANGPGDRLHDTLSVAGDQGAFMLLDRLALPQDDGLFDIRLDALDDDAGLIAGTAIRLDLVGTDPLQSGW